MPRVVCDICPHNCTLIDGKGLCGKREYNLGKFSAINIDPIEKKPLYHVYPGSSTLSLGSVGCNLKCPWCQNFTISKEFEKRELITLPPTQLMTLCKDQKLNSVSFTYNEPSIAYEYIVESSELLKNNGIDTFIVSSGYISKKYLESFYKNIKAVNIDLKSFNDQNYKKTLGGDLKTVLNTLEYINSKADTWLEVTTLLIPGFNDSKKELKNLITWIKNNLGVFIPLHFSAYYPNYKFTHIERTGDNSILKAVDMAKSMGLKYVYPGNIKSGDYSTYCLECHTKIIDRVGYRTKNILIDGKCPGCGNPLDGIFT